MVGKTGRGAFNVGGGCLIVFAAFVVLALTKPITQDEGVFLTIGKYLNQGWLPYQDFVDHKPPAIHFLFAALIKIFGTNVWVIKAALIVSVLGVAALLRNSAEILKPGTSWYAATIFLFLMTQFEGYFLIAEPFLLLPLLAAFWIILRWPLSHRWYFVAGALMAITILFKQTALLSVAPIMILAFRQARKSKGTVVAGLALPFVVLGVYLLAHGIMSEAWHQVVTLTLASYPRESLPFILQSLKLNFTWTLPIWMLALLGFWGQMKNKGFVWALILVPLPFMFFRHYPHYWVQILPFVALLAASVLVDLRLARVKLAAMIFCLAIAGGKVGQDMGPNFKKLKAQFDAAKVLRDSPAKRVLVENQFTAFYFLLPQRPLNKFLYITEVTDAAGAEQRTINDLQRGQEVLILWPEDKNFAYAKKLQKFIDENGSIQKAFSVLGMRVMELK